MSTLTLLRTFNLKKENEITAADLATIKLPVQLIWGENDTFASVKQGQQIAAAFGDARFDLVTGAGHMPWIDQTEKCGGLIDAFQSEKHQHRKD